MNIIINILAMTVPFSVALLLASIGEMFNQRSGVFNLGCEGIMAMGAFVGMLIPFAVGGGGAVANGWNYLGLLLATIVGALMGLFFGPLLSDIPVIGEIFFSHNLVVYLAFLFVPLAWYILMKTSWGLEVRAVGTYPRAADSMGINVNRIRYEALAVGGALAGLAGAYLSVCQIKMFSDDLIAGRGFIAVALVYFGHWKPVRIMLGALLFSFTQTIQYNVQGLGINIPYEFFVMLPYVVVVVVLAFTSRNQTTSPAALGKPFNREIRT